MTAVERNRRVRATRRRNGYCWFCRKPVAPGSKSQCIEHLDRGRARKRNAVGSGAWRPGSAGRPPIWAKREGLA